MTQVQLDSRQGVEAKRRLNRIRVESLMALSEGMLTLEEFFDSATASDGRALAGIQVRQLLTWLPGFKTVDVNIVYSSLLLSLGLDPDSLPPKTVTIRWLLDKRSAGRRWEAFWLALRTHEMAMRSDDGIPQPWPGFPFARNPQEKK